MSFIANPKMTTAPVNRICGVMVSMLASSVVDRGLEPLSGQIKAYKINICCYSSKHAALRIKSRLVGL